MTSPSQLSRKDALVAVLVAAVIAISLLVGGRAMPATQATSANAAAAAPSLVVAVDSADPQAVAAAWRAVPAAALPGQVLVIPASADPACPERIADSGTRAGDVIAEAVACSADSSSRAAARAATLQRAAEQARDSRTALVLLGDGWTQSLPLPVADPADKQQIGAAVLGAAGAGQLPDLRGLTVTVAAPAPAAAEKGVWDAYFTAAGARRVEWVRA